MAEESIELTNNLENLLSPFCYQQETPLPKTIPEVPGGMYLSGFISQDCTWGCCYNHSVIKCFPVDRCFDDSHTSFAAHSSNASVAVSSSSYTFVGGHITCATELAIHNLRTSSGMRKLLLGLSFTSDNNNRDVRGAVVIFDPIRCAPMKWIEIPDPVSSITVLSHFEEGGSNRPFFNETMMAMVGIAAVGLRGGSVIIIDLGLDDPVLSSAPASDGRHSSDSTYRLLYVNPHEYVIATKRHKAVSKRSLISLKFTNEPEVEMIADAFYYCKPNGESMMAVHKNSVAVTCLEYIPAIGSLLVGFTCGGFQIWRVNNMELQFSSEPVMTNQRDEPAHVFGFSFQQPVDDPKNYCYIWVMYGNKSAECTNNTHVELHSLYYERKNFIDNFGFVYDGFKQCAKRMSFPLLDDFLSSDSENEDLDSIRCSARPIRIWTQPESDLMYCAWEVGRGGVFYVGAFDLNQWYSNHTKEHIFYNPDSGLCPYWVALPVEISDVSNFVMDVRIIPKSLMRWENPHSKLDVHLYPASVSFRAVCLTNTGVSALEHFGVQEKLVRIVLKDGPSLMIQPENIKSSFIRYGLEPVFQHIYGEHLSLKDRDRFFILTVLLESRRTPAIIRLASVWLDGSYANVGCTIDLIINWIGGYMVALRGGADEHWHNLFDFGDDTLPPETIRFINFSNFVWTSLHRLLNTLMGPTEVYTVRKQELENMEFGLGKLVQYSAALLMMHKARLLPECDGSFLKNLTDYYEQRRHEAKSALETCVYMDNQFKKSHPLMIDYLMDSLMAEEELRDEWHVEEGQHCYPPQHVGYLVNMFLWPDADPKAVSRVFMYFLIDLSFYSQNADTSHNQSSSSIVERKVRGDFKAVMDSTAEEYQEIYVLWLLDHGIPNEILVHLKENDRLYQNDGLPWCAATVALTAAGYENDVAELLLKSCPHSLAKLLFSLMTSSMSKYTSLAELMISSNLSADEELLQQFFEISESRERLAEFIRSKSKELPERVEISLLTFLNSSDSVKRLSQLLMYYVHTENYRKLGEEFGRVRDILRHRNLSDTDRKMWTFQETYINHLLSTTKGSIVQQFLRLQTHQSVRFVQPTLSIRAIPATNVSPSDEVADHVKIVEPKLPPHLRRLKLSESIAHDPLSPLRRYAGRIHNAVTAVTSDSDGENNELRSRRFSSRRSFSRRHSIVNPTNTTCNNNEMLNNEDRLNITSKNSHIDLISLLKTPTVDHRIDNRQRNSFTSFIQTVPQGIADENLSQLIVEPSIHSIMKEVDPSKPKVTKKVELRFENLSLSSEEGDEKNATIYEDADENLEEDEEGDNNIANAAFETSSSSAFDKSLYFESESAGDSSILQPDADQEIAEVESNVTQDNVPVPSEKEPVAIPDIKSVVEANVSVDDGEEIENAQFEETHQHNVADENEQVAAEVMDQSVVATMPAELVERSNIIGSELTPDVEQDVEEGEQVQLPSTSKKSSRKRKLKALQQEDVSLVKEDLESARSEMSYSDDSVAAAKVEAPKKKRKGSKRKNQSAEEEVAHKKSQVGTSERISTDTDTSTKPLHVIEEEEEMPTKSNSTTPIKEIQSDDTVEMKRPPRRSSRSSVSISGEVYEEEPEENEEVRILRRSSRVSRSRTPTRDAVDQDMVADEAEKKVQTRRTLRATRSTTPTRDPIPEVPEDESESKRILRSTRSTRSKTPTRDTELKSAETSPATTRRETRASKTPSRDVSTDDGGKTEESKERETETKVRTSLIKSLVSSLEQSSSSSFKFEVTQEGMQQDDEQVLKPEDASLLKEDVDTARSEVSYSDDSVAAAKAEAPKKKRKGTKRKVKSMEEKVIPESETITTDSKSLDVIEEEEEMPTKSNSTTPIKEIQSDDTVEMKRPPRRSSRSSVSINRELYEDGPEENEEVRNLRRSSRVSRSRTPTRDAVDQDMVADEAEKKVQTRRTLRSTRSTTPTRDPIPEVPEDESESKRILRSTRSTRSKTPTRDTELKSAETSPATTRRETRASKTPSRDASTDEGGKTEVSKEIETGKKVRTSLLKALVSPEQSEKPSSSSFSFEITQEEMEQDEEDVEEDTVPPISNKSTTAHQSKARKRRLKYLQQPTINLSTVIEDSETERSEPSLFEATVIAPKVEPPKNRKIKGIKARQPVEEDQGEPEDVPSRPAKRRKPAIVDDFVDDDDDDVQSIVSSRSARSVSSRKSTGSTKPKTTRRKARSSSKSNT